MCTEYTFWIPESKEFFVDDQKEFPSFREFSNPAGTQSSPVWKSISPFRSSSILVAWV
jgi:hypothetical protein